jgi:hypothetical protein
VGVHNGVVIMMRRNKYEVITLGCNATRTPELNG